MQPDGQIIVFDIVDESWVDLGLNNGDEIGMINRLVPTDIENAKQLLDETSIELVITQNIGYTFKHLYNYASPFGSLRNNLHDEQMFDS